MELAYVLCEQFGRVHEEVVSHLRFAALQRVRRQVPRRMREPRRFAAVDALLRIDARQALQTQAQQRKVAA
jgi:hypothetical protein